MNGPITKFKFNLNFFRIKMSGWGGPELFGSFSVSDFIHLLQIILRSCTTADFQESHQIYSFENDLQQIE